jgi:uncharacterized protein YjeT (DUF2065 family)
MKQAAIKTAAVPSHLLRSLGLLAACLGVVIVWLLRRG